MFKKVIYLFAVVLTAFMFVSCTTGSGPTGPVTDENEVKVIQVNQLINQLPDEITLDNEDIIKQIINLYDSLPVKYREKIINYNKVLEAKTLLDELKTVQNLMNQAQTIIDAINALPKVEELTLDHTESVNSVKESYNKLSNDVKQLVTNYNTLETLINKLKELKQAVQAKINEVINAINNLPSVENLKISDKELVENAKTLYNGLLAGEKELVTNISKLEALETKLVEIEKIENDKENAQVIVDLINSLPNASEVTIDDKKKVDEVRNAYNNLVEDVKQYVTNIAKLENIETRISELIIAKSKADTVINLINSLPNVNDVDVDDKEKVEAARTAYNNLSNDEKLFVNNLNKLEKLEEKIEELEFFATNNILNCVSDIATSDTVDTLILENKDASFKWSSSNKNLYVINGEVATINKAYQTHQTQTVTVTVTITYKSGGTATKSKQITVDPVLFDTMPSTPVATYFQSGATSTYKSYSERYKKENTLFSNKAKEVLDIVYYAFATPKSNGTISIENISYFNEVIKLRQEGIRVVLSINGVGADTYNAFNTITKDANLISEFVKNTMDLVDANYLDGVDLDWESVDSNRKVNATQMNNLAKAFRQEMNNRQAKNGTPYLLTAAIPGTSWGAGSDRFDLKTLNSYLDYVNMMSYDVNRTDKTTHLSPAYISSNDGGYGFGIEYGTTLFTNAGLSKSKIIVGSAGYGKAYKVTGTVSSTSKYPGLGVSGTITQISGVTGSFASGTLFGNAIDTLLKNSAYVKYIEYNSKNQIAGSYLYNATNKIFVSYESEEVILAKYQFAKQYTGMGIMCWAYTEDTSDRYINTIYDALN